MKLHNTKVGAKVLITKDAREGGKATGQYGTYEGDFPLTVNYFFKDDLNAKATWLGEGLYSEYESGETKIIGTGEPAKEVFIEWKHGEECPAPYFVVVSENPRIRLADGSVIWGAECWWGEVVEGVTLEQAQKQTEDVIDMIRSVANARKESE